VRFGVFWLNSLGVPLKGQKPIPNGQGLQVVREGLARQQWQQDDKKRQQDGIERAQERPAATEIEHNPGDQRSGDRSYQEKRSQPG
jgi:hypothetical protein